MSVGASALRPIVFMLRLQDDREHAKMKYRVFIEQDEDGVFVVECPALPGCISQGNTRAEALANIREAIQGYLESLAMEGDPIPPGVEEETVEVNL